SEPLTGWAAPSGSRPSLYRCGCSVGGGVLADETGQQLDQGRVHAALLGQEAVDLPLQALEALAQAVDLLVEVADLEAQRGQVALDDAELAVGLLRRLFVAAGQRGQLAVGDGVFRHVGSLGVVAARPRPRLSQNGMQRR
ncbi:hypothetical protein, partial [Streptomyces sp900116325]|uniref:hypothetical protein n=1 Tax=Streptomyces sp. 900116325 TaxID=3154295 RepID=UPI0033B270E9